MRLAYLALVLAAALSSIGDAAAPAETSVGPRNSLSYGDDRFLRSHERTASDASVDEERDLFGMFAKAKLKKMMKSESFKNEMYQQWDTKTVGQIAAKLKVDKYHPRWGQLLFDYLNVYKKGGAEAVRKASNGKTVKFDNKVTLRVFKKRKGERRLRSNDK
jgi:hypothetical protein